MTTMTGVASPTRTRIAAASFIGTAIEFYDFYIFGTAAALVFGKLFFPSFSATAGTLAALATFAVGFIARPVGAVLFGHFGGWLGRKRMLIVSLLMLGLSTVAIGLVPSFATIGVAAPVLLAVLRFVQGIGLGGEWGGAVLLATVMSPHPWPRMR
jgi:MFS family permease